MPIARMLDENSFNELPGRRASRGFSKWRRLAAGNKAGADDPNSKLTSFVDTAGLMVYTASAVQGDNKFLSGYNPYWNIIDPDTGENLSVGDNTNWDEIQFIIRFDGTNSLPDAAFEHILVGLTDGTTSFGGFGGLAVPGGTTKRIVAETNMDASTPGGTTVTFASGNIFEISLRRGVSGSNDVVFNATSIQRTSSTDNKAGVVKTDGTASSKDAAPRIQMSFNVNAGQTLKADVRYRITRKVNPHPPGF